MIEDYYQNFLTSKLKAMEKKAIMRLMENVSESKTESVSASAIVRCHFQTQLQPHTKGKPNANEDIATTMKVAPSKKSTTPKPETRKGAQPLLLSQSHCFVHQMDSLSVATLAR
ncbi:hypothetical protein RFI_35756, partial [Reticulomyxa filosa]